jgi:hypothetical protein
VVQIHPPLPLQSTTYRHKGLEGRRLSNAHLTALLATVLAVAAPARAADTLDAQIDRVVARRLEAAPLERGQDARSISAPWILAPLVCQLVDAGTALHGNATRARFQENGPVARHLIERPALLIASKAAVGLATAAAVRLVDRRAGRAAAKALSIGTCGVSLYGAGTNVRLWRSL